MVNELPEWLSQRLSMLIGKNVMVSVIGPAEVRGKLTSAGEDYVEIEKDGLDVCAVSLSHIVLVTVKTVKDGES